MVLGAFVAIVNPKRRQNIAFACFALAYGLDKTLDNFDNALGFQYSPAVSPIAYSVAAAGIVATGILFPRPLARHERAILWAPIGAAAALLVFNVSVLLLHGQGRSPTESAGRTSTTMAWTASSST